MRISLPNSTPQVVEVYNELPVSVAVFPAASSSISVEFSISSDSDIKGGTALWQAWGKGTVTANATDYFPSTISALRVTAVTGTGTVEFIGLKDDK